jgi:hypothetical protein
MTTEQKKALLNSSREAHRALGQLLDGHDFKQLPTFSDDNVGMLRENIIGAMCGLAILSESLTSEIGTDNL